MEKPKPHIEVLHTYYTELPDATGKLQPQTTIIYRDEAGVIGHIVLPKKSPSDAEIAAAVKKAREEAEKRKPHIIPL